MQSSKSKRSNGYCFDDPVCHIMLSYSWSNKERVNQLVTRLDSYIHFWRDKSNLSGAKDLWTAIANAIHKSEFVVAILTQEYVESDSCTNELNYALNIKKPVVPVFLDPNFKPTGNVGLRTSKLFYIVYNDIIENPLLFVKHLNAMSAKLHNINLNEISTFQASYLKYSIIEIERMINHNIRDKIFDFNNNNSPQLQQTINNNNNTIRNKLFIMNNIYNASKYAKIERGDIENIDVRNLNLGNDYDHLDQKQDFLSKLSCYNNSVADNDFINSLNVYGMQANRTGNLINYVDLKIPYKLGDSMYLINENDELGKKLTELNLDHNDKSFDLNARHGFNIHQTKPDPNNYDFYTKEKDELCSFVCQGKRVEILDSDYQDVNDFIFKPKEENTTLELAFDLSDDVLSCFLHIEDDLMLIATEKGEFNLMKPNKSKLTFVRCILNPKYNGNDYEFYKKGEKTIVDICLDSSGNLLILNRWNFKEDSTQTTETKFTIELFNFNRKKVDGISYMRTICCLNNEDPVSSNEANFTRIFNDEPKNCIVLIDSAKNKIYWHKKSNGSKKRCLKSQDNTLENPKSLAMIVDEQNSIDIMFICTKSGLVASSQNFTIKHEVIMPVDIYYDLYDKSIYFISSYKIYEGNLFNNSKSNHKKNDSTLANKKYLSEDLDIKYKLLFSCNSIENKRELKRIVTSKNFIFVLCGPELNSNSSKAIMFAYTKFKN